MRVEVRYPDIKFEGSEINMLNQTKYAARLPTPV